MTTETSKARGGVLVPRELLEAAVCPMKESGCDGMQYPVQPYGEGEQCQWCYERRASLAAPPPAADDSSNCRDCDGQGRVEVRRKVTHQLGTDEVLADEDCQPCEGVGIVPPPAAAHQPDHLVDANKMVAQQPAAIAPVAWLCTFGEVSGVTTDPKWRDICARLGQQITPLVPIFTQKPAAVDEAACVHGCRCGCCRACKRGHYEPTRHSTCDCYATQHQEPTNG